MTSVQSVRTLNSSPNVEGLSESEESRDVWLRLLGLKTDARAKEDEETSWAYDERSFGWDLEDVFSIPTGLLSNLPMIHRENETDPIFVDLIKSNIPEEESPRLQKRKSASKISRIAKVERESLAWFSFCFNTKHWLCMQVPCFTSLYCTSSSRIEAYFMVLTMITHTKRRRGAYFHLDQHHEWAGSHSSSTF